MTRNILLYLTDILRNMENAEAFVGDLSYEAFAADLKSLYAVIRCVEVIGEAAKNIPGHVRRRYPGIPWKEMAGMRDKVIHFYFGVDPRKVWLVVRERIPEIKPLIKKVLEELKG